MRKYILILTVCISLLHSYGSTAQVITTFAGSTALSGGDGGPATAAGLNSPRNVAADDSGNVYVIDYNNYVVRKINPAGIISRFAGNGVRSTGGDGIPATSVPIGFVSGIAADSTGNVFISEYGRVRKIDKSNIITTVAGNGTYTSSGDGGPATAAGIGSIYGVHADRKGNIYAVDYTNKNVRKINSAGIISTIAGNGTAGYSGDGGPATNAQLFYPQEVATDGFGNVYITDHAYNVVRKVDPSGIITTFAGNTSAFHSGDGGPATAAGIHTPYGVTVDRNNNVYISETVHSYVRVVDPLGIINTYAGNGVPSYLGDGEPATAASLYDPAGISIDGCNNLYIADHINVRKVSGILGSAVICIGSPVTLSEKEAGGTWSSSATGIATIDPLSGYVTPVSAGFTDISYKLGVVKASTTMSVTPIPYSGIITGPAYVCVDKIITLTDTVTNGFWNQTTGKALVISYGNTLRGYSPGPDTIVFQYSNACGIARTFYPLNVLDKFQCDSALCVNTQPVLSSEMQVYPNPNNGTFSVSVTSAVNEEVPAVIINMLGQKIKGFSIISNRVNELKNDLGSGVYFLIAGNSPIKQMVKFIVR